MPSLSNQELLAGITEAINSALDTTLRARLDALQSDFDALRASNVELMERNNVLINLNKALIERRDSVPLASWVLPGKYPPPTFLTFPRHLTSRKKNSSTYYFCRTPSTVTLASHVRATPDRVSETDQLWQISGSVTPPSRNFAFRELKRTVS